jgi:hypothetical protein
MSQCKILVDTNVYLRLAQSINPLLKKSFGSQNYCLYVLPEMSDEYHANPRLESSFPWFESEEYIENRNHRWYLSREQRDQIENVYDFILDASYNSALNVSRVDIKCLAFAYVLQIPVSTDDAEMIVLADEFGIKSITMLQLLKIMLDCAHVSIDNIRSIAGYLISINDLPKNFMDDYRSIFREEPPMKGT